MAMSLNSKEDYLQLASALCSGIIKKINVQDSVISIEPRFVSSYANSTADFETFSRPLWAFAGFKYSNKASDISLIQQLMEMIKNGTNPNSNCFWGKVQDYDQKLVEMSSILLFVVENQNEFDRIFSAQDKEYFNKWFNQINSVNSVNNNWLFFAIIVNSCLNRLGMLYCQKKIDENWTILQAHYIGNGWYTDGETTQKDYYIAFAYHFYSLLWVYIFPECEHAAIIRERAELFAKQFILFFDSNGSAVAYGRSLIYRFAQGAFWSAYILGGCSEIPYGVVKGIINRHLRWWTDQDILMIDGCLAIGYAYPNDAITEPYNATGSPYWCMKIFVLLLIDGDNQYWNESETPYACQDGSHFLDAADMFVSCHKGHSILFSANQRASWKFPHAVSKYERFCYSSRAGLNIMRDNSRLENIALDSTCALILNDTIILAKEKTQDSIVEKRVIHQKWNPIPTMNCEIWIIPGNPYHVRVFEITTNTEIEFCDFGFAIDSNKLQVRKKSAACVLSNASVTSGITSIYGNGVGMFYEAAPNTNILFPRTDVPYIKWKLKPGNYVCVDAVFLGDKWESDNIPVVDVEKDEVRIQMNHDCFAIQLLSDKNQKPNNYELRMNKLVTGLRKIKRKVTALVLKFEGR